MIQTNIIIIKQKQKKNFMQQINVKHFKTAKKNTSFFYFNNVHLANKDRNMVNKIQCNFSIYIKQTKKTRSFRVITN